MISKELIGRINYLARKSKSEGLTAEEKEEQQALRKEYLAAFRKNFKAQLDAIDIVDEEGNIIRRGGARVVEKEEETVTVITERITFKE